MIDTTDVLRDQMEATKSQLSDKLESLELRVAGTVQSASTAVTATVEAVQDAVTSVRNTFDLQRITGSHPWLVVGGAAAIGYLATKAFTSVEPADNSPALTHPASAAVIAPEHRNGTSNTHTNAITNSARITPETSVTNSAWDQLRIAAVGAFIGIASDMASRAAPLLMDYLTSSPGRKPDSSDPESPKKEMI